MLHILKIIAAIVVTIVVLILIARVVFALPNISQRSESRAFPATEQTKFGKLMAEGQRLHPGKSGVIPLPGGHDALGSRLALIANAERSIDAQYYIWHDDTSGIILLDALLQAAARGVRVRLLLDDNGVPGLDPYMAALNAQDNFAIRLFNPSTIRTPKMAGYTFAFLRMNRRMHNKSLIADGAVAIIGGRNIGDEYFQVGKDAFYVDMDALATGAVVPETARVFDEYWNSASVFEVETIIDGDGDLPAFRARAKSLDGEAETMALLRDLESSAGRYTRGLEAMEWTDVRLVADDPVKGMGTARRDQLMMNRLGEILGSVEHRIDLVSAYFVPGRKGTDYFGGLADDGKQVNILTNALNTTDVLMVHAGYTKYRRDLLKSGVRLFELKLRGDMTPEADLQLKPFGLSGASLHAKTFSIDEKRVFIGSFNFDPRSEMLNCEMGFVIDSPKMAQRVSGSFDGPMDAISYKPELTPEKKMIWKEQVGGDTVVYQGEPGANWLQQAAISVIGVLPVEWLL